MSKTSLFKTVMTKAKKFCKEKKRAIRKAVYLTVILGVFLFVLFNAIIPMYNYYEAKDLIGQGKYSEAYSAIVKAGDFSDAAVLRKNFLCVAGKEETSYPQITGKYETYREFDENGNCIMSITNSPEGYQSITENAYDEHGYCIKRITTDPDGQNEIDYIYIYEGSLVKEMIVSQNGGSEITSKYEYDNNGNCVKTVTVMPDGKENIQTNEYDKGGNKVKTFTKTGGGYEETVCYTYNNSLCIREETKDGDGEIKKTVTYSYDDNGVPVKRAVKDSDGSTETTVYETNDDGLCIKETLTDSSGVTETTYSDYKIFYKG